MKRYFAFLFVGLFISCGSDEPAGKITPSNLTLNATISTDGSGLVTFVAKADNAVKYNYFFGESTADPLFESIDGSAKHTYLNTNTFTVTVVAYSSDNLFINKELIVSVDVKEPVISDVGFSTPLTYPNMTLVWQDEFSGNELNPVNWTHETGNGVGGWGNNELQFYKAENTSVQDGYLVIKAKKEAGSGVNYTSSRIITKGKKEFKYGRVDIRAILPKGQGIWPALWMLGSNFNDVGVGWPKCGEIDIMELVGGNAAGKNDKIYGTVHWDNAGSYASYGGNKTLTNGKIFADEFHVFSLVWNDKFIRWYLDDVQYHVIDISPSELSEFQAKFFFIFNVAVGGNWPGIPDGTTVLPQRMVVDYVRVFQ